MTRFIVVLFALVACSNPGLSVAELKKLNAVGLFDGDPTEHLGGLHFERPGEQWSCVLMADDIAVTVDGAPSTFYAGDSGPDEDGHEACGPAGIDIDTAVVPTAPDAISYVELHDSTGDAGISIIAPYGSHTFDVDGGHLAAGQRATLRWPVPTDTLEPGTGFSEPGMQVACYAPDGPKPWGELLFVASSGPRAGHPDWLAMDVAGVALSFDVPAIAYRGPVWCVVNLKVEGGIATCDFASCRSDFVAFVGEAPALVIPHELIFQTSI